MRAEVEQHDNDVYVGEVKYFLEVTHTSPSVPDLTFVVCRLHAAERMVIGSPLGTGVWQSKAPLRPSLRKGHDAFPVALKHIEEKLPTIGRPNPTATSSDTSNPHRTPAPAANVVSVAQADDEEELELNYEENDSAMDVDTTQGEAAETPVTEMLAESSPASKPAIAANLASLTAESHQLSKPQRISIQLERHPSQPTSAGKGRAATTAKLKKKQPRGRSRSDGATRNRSRSKPRLSGTRS
eukprot:jgi/Tetstr1/446469/TSEL_034010.t1